MRLQVARPSNHAAIASLPFVEPLRQWSIPGIHRALGVHRHVVKIVELGDITYVVKELPDDLALREYRLLRQLAEDGLPTAEVVAVASERTENRQPLDGILVTRHLDYSLPYRNLLAGRGLTIPFLGDRMLDALVGLLVRLHLAGFYWGDCSLSNALFRRDAGALSAYAIDMETGERHEQLTDGQRNLDLMIATENVAGGLLDLQTGGRLHASIDPFTVAGDIQRRYDNLWNELTGADTLEVSDVHSIENRLARLHDLGFDVEEMEIVTIDRGHHMRIVPRVVEHGFSADRLLHLTGLVAEENQARRMLNDIRTYAAELQQQSGNHMPENVAAVRWLDQRFEPIMSSIPLHKFDRLQAAEIFHQILEHRWYMAEERESEVTIEEAVEAYLLDILSTAPNERLQLDDTAEIEAIELDPDALETLDDVPDPLG